MTWIFSHKKSSGLLSPAEKLKSLWRSAFQCRIHRKSHSRPLQWQNYKNSTVNTFIRSRSRTLRRMRTQVRADTRIVNLTFVEIFTATKLKTKEKQRDKTFKKHETPNTIKIINFMFRKLCATVDAAVESKRCGDSQISCNSLLSKQCNSNEKFAHKKITFWNSVRWFCEFVGQSDKLAVQLNEKFVWERVRKRTHNELERFIWS